MKNTYKIFFFTVTYALFIMYVQPANSQESGETQSIGKVVFTSGKVRYKSQVISTKKIQSQQLIYQGDEITTKKNGLVVIVFHDGMKITLRPKSKLEISAFPNQAEEGEILLSLFKGGMRTVTGLIGKTDPDKLTVDTPWGSIGVRGTDWVTRICHKKQCNKQMTKISQCQEVEQVPTKNRVFVSVLKGGVILPACKIQNLITPGRTGVFLKNQEQCETLNKVPCFVNYDPFFYEGGEEGNAGLSSDIDKAQNQNQNQNQNQTDNSVGHSQNTADQDAGQGRNNSNPGQGQARNGGNDNSTHGGKSDNAAHGTGQD